MVDVPHFDLPFRFVGKHPAVVEQDTLDDISNCVEAIVRTLVGQRPELPDFGIPDPTFENQPVDLSQIANAVIRQEPRATTLLQQAPDVFSKLIADVTLRVSAQEVSSG